MFGGDRDDLTICAVSTPFGYGGISVLRLSGPRSLEITKKIAPFLPPTPETHRVYFGTLHGSSQGDLDEVLVTYFTKGKSFTGEEVIEISCHGSPVVCDSIINTLVSGGAALALPGEFTYRAFMNGRMDLTQAESIISLIHSRSERSAQISLRHLKGDLSSKFNQLEEDLLWALAHSEAQIDFSTEVIKAASPEEIQKRIHGALKNVDALCGSFDPGRVINEGLKVALVGRPNAGKSSLYNILVQKNRAIVSETPGTTRDLLETNIHHRGSNIVLLDTAGLRSETSDQIEKLGIGKALDEVKDADVVLWLHDLTTDFSGVEDFLTGQKNFLFLGTKADLVSPQVATEFRDTLIAKGALVGPEDRRFLTTTTRAPETRISLLDRLFDLYFPTAANDQVFIVHQRQHAHLKEIQATLKTALESMVSGVGYEFVSLELKTALINTQEILGKVFDDQILDKVFKEFCIGK